MRDGSVTHLRIHRRGRAVPAEFGVTPGTPGSTSGKRRAGSPATAVAVDTAYWRVAGQSVTARRLNAPWPTTARLPASSRPSWLRLSRRTRCRPLRRYVAASM